MTPINVALTAVQTSDSTGLEAQSAGGKGGSSITGKALKAYGETRSAYDTYQGKVLDLKALRRNRLFEADETKRRTKYEAWRNDVYTRRVSGSQRQDLAVAGPTRLRGSPAERRSVLRHFKAHWICSPDGDSTENLMTKGRFDVCAKRSRRAGGHSGENETAGSLPGEAHEVKDFPRNPPRTPRPPAPDAAGKNGIADGGRVRGGEAWTGAAEVIEARRTNRSEVVQ